MLTLHGVGLSVSQLLDGLINLTTEHAYADLLQNLVVPGEGGRGHCTTVLTKWSYFPPTINWTGRWRQPATTTAQSHK